MKKIKIAVNAGIAFGAKLNATQLLTIAKYMAENEELELTTFHQLYLEIPEERKDEIIDDLKSVGLVCYPVGSFVKSLRTCNFCKGEEEEGMPVAKQINEMLAGAPVPFTLKIAYTGCPVGCGEPLVNDIGITKKRDTYSIYIGGKSKGQDARVGFLFMEGLCPEDLYYLLDKIILKYQKLGKKREQFYKFVNRIGLDELRRQVAE